MIDNSILDEVLPIPDIAEEKSKIVAELQEEGFTVTNFSSGGVFNMLLMIILQAKIEIIKLARNLLNNMFISHSEGIWTDLKAADYSRLRKDAVKTQGVLTLRADNKHVTITIPKGTIFKTDKDINGDELRYFSTQKVTLMDTDQEIQVPVEAEKEGADYNVSQGQIARCLVFLPGVTDIHNVAEWITREGSDVESDESLKARTLNAWADLAKRPIAQSYKNVCEAVEGVLYVNVDDMHPRGQGTVDIIVTSTAGEATEALLEKVRAAADSIKGEYDNVLVKSSETVRQDISVTVILPDLISKMGVKESVEEVIRNYFKISVARNLNQLILLDIVYAIKKTCPVVKNIRMVLPQQDVQLTKDKVIILGKLEVVVIWEGEQDG